MLFANVFQSREILHLRDKSFTKFLISFDENLLTFFKKKTRDKIVVFGWIFQETVHCVKNKTLGIFRVSKGCFQCFDVAVKIERDALNSVEGTYKPFSFPLGGYY